MSERSRWVKILTGPWFGFAMLLVGLGVGTWAVTQAVADPFQSGVETFVGWMADAAPYIILISILPALLELFDMGEGGKASVVVILLFSFTTLIAGLYAILVAWPLFGLPLTGQETGGILETLVSVFDRVGTSAPFIAVLAAFFWGFVLHRIRVLGRNLDPEKEGAGQRFLQGLVYVANRTIAVFRWIMDEGIIRLGRYLEYALPFLLFAVGTFVPEAVEQARAQATAEASGIDAVTLYLLTTALVAVVTFVYLLAVAFIAARVSKTSLKDMLGGYMPPVYAFAWSTASSTATIPINLEAAKENLKINRSVREFIIPLGATINLDGTMMGAMLITPMVTDALGIPLTLSQLLAMYVPLLFITIGAPGIPGGLSIIAPPVLAAILGLQGDVATAFIGVWVALSFGLTDQFRTAVNSTNNGLLCLIVQRILGIDPDEEVDLEVFEEQDEAATPA